MADRSDIRFKAGQATGQAQLKKDEIVDKASDACQQGKEHAGGIIQQTGEKAMNIAQGAADAVKNAVGLGDATAGNTAASTTTTTRTTASKR